MAREVDDSEDTRRIARKLEERHQYQARARAMPRKPPRPARPARGNDLGRGRKGRGSGGGAARNARVDEAEEEDEGYGRMENGVAHDHAPVSTRFCLRFAPVWIVKRRIGSDCQLAE